MDGRANIFRRAFRFKKYIKKVGSWDRHQPPGLLLCGTEYG